MTNGPLSIKPVDNTLFILKTRETISVINMSDNQFNNTKIIDVKEDSVCYTDGL